MDEKRLTDALERLRAHAYERPPQPSRQLSDRLDLRMLADLPTVNGAVQVVVAVEAPERRSRLRAILSWLAGLGIVTKVVLGIGVAAIATTGVGAAGALPAPAQQLFDSVLPGIAPHSSETADDPSDQPGDDIPGTTEPSTHTAVPEDEDGTGDESTEGDGAGKPADTPGNGGDGTGKPADTPGNGGDGTGKPADTPGNGGDGTGKPDNTPGGNPNK
ncbi:MAG: hypothetical protein LCH43_11835 [Actinobacteria bacterium]|nr:hypothetical protein [Actinomycetota bacterium]